MLRSIKFLPLLLTLFIFSCSHTALTENVQKQEPVEPIQVFVIGDSTASHYQPDVYPRMGWAMALPNALGEHVNVFNHAKSGRSSRSYLHEGWFDKFKDEIKAGDYLFIQFGHNDQKETKNRKTEPYSSYQAYLTKYINYAQAKGATPILLTSINRVKFSEDKQRLVLTHGNYPDAMRQLANNLQVTLVDLTALTEAKFNQLGYDKTRASFLFYPPGIYPAYPNGVADGTHLSVAGADLIVELIANTLKTSQPKLFSY